MASCPELEQTGELIFFPGSGSSVPRDVAAAGALLGAAFEDVDGVGVATELAVLLGRALPLPCRITTCLGRTDHA